MKKKKEMMNTTQIKGRTQKHSWPRPGFGTREVSSGIQTPVDLYTPGQVVLQEVPHHASVLDRVTCPSDANCDDKIDSDLFGVSDLSVARVGAVSELGHELRAYEVLRSVAGGFRTVKAQLVMPTGTTFDVPHLLIDRHTPLSRYASQITDGSVWDLAALLDRMHRSGVAHGYIHEGSVGVVQDTSGPVVLAHEGAAAPCFRQPAPSGCVAPLGERKAARNL